MSLTHEIVKGSERVPLHGARALGPANEHEWVEVTIKVRRKKRLPDVDGHITRKELVEKFGATKEDCDAITTALSTYGLDVIEVNPATRTVRVAGPVAAMEKAFQVRLVRYSHARGEYRGRIGPVQIPSKIAPYVEGVFGLDNRRVVKHRESPRRPTSLATHAKARPWFFPAELAKAYDFPQGDGAGQTIAVLEFGGGFFADDLATFCQAAAVTVPKVTPISVDHTPTNEHDGAVGEVMLDVQVIAGVCPKANIALYFSSFTEKGWIDVLDAAIHDANHDSSVISISWGDSEDSASWTTQARTQIDQSLHEAALLGITVCVASGDDGSDDQVQDGHAHVDYPASSPFALGVGGTALRVKNGKPVEIVWKDGTGLRRDGPGNGSTGGGVSVAYPLLINQPSIPSVNPHTGAGRVVPDVAANAAGSTGYIVVVDGKGEVSGGTSAAAPLWAALIALVNGAVGSRTGYLTRTLYEPSRIDQTKRVGQVVCRDIANGNNVTAAVGGYNAKEGEFDAVTGWGAPIGTKLVQELTARKPTAKPTP